MSSRWRFLGLVFLLLPGVNASAERIAAHRQWALDDTNLSDPGSGQCVASTGARLGREDYSLNIIVDKTGARPVEVLVRPLSGVSAVQIFKAAVSRDVYFFSSLPGAVYAGDQAWHPPRDTAKLIDTLIRKSTFPVAAVTGGRGTITFSLSGSSVVLNEMRRRCAFPSLTAAAGFERAFLPPEALTFDGTKLTTANTGPLRDLLVPGFAAHSETEAIRAEMQALELRYASPANERDALKASVNQWTTRDLPEQQQIKTDAAAKIQQAERDIQTEERSLRDLSSQLVAARAARDAAAADLAPQKTEHDRLSAIKAADATRARDAERALANNDANISSYTERIRALEGEAATIDRDVRALRERLRDARAEQFEAERAVRNFDVNREIRARQLANPRHQQLQRGIEDLGRRERQAQDEVRAFERQLAQAQSNLRSCESVTPSDCTIERNEVQNANQRLAQSRRGLQAVQAEANRYRAELDQLERQIERAVLDDQRQLDARASRAQSLVLNLENAIANKEDRLDAINLRELPRYRDALNTARANRPTLVARVSDTRTALARSTADLDAFKRRVGYDGLIAKRDQTAAKVRELESQVRDAQATIASRRATIVDQTRIRDTAEQRIADLNARVVAGKDRLRVLDGELAAYDREKAAIARRLSASELKLNELKSQYAALLPR